MYFPFIVIIIPTIRGSEPSCSLAPSRSISVGINAWEEVLYGNKQKQKPAIIQHTHKNAEWKQTSNKHKQKTTNNKVLRETNKNQKNKSTFLWFLRSFFGPPEPPDLGKAGAKPPIWRLGTFLFKAFLWEGFGSLSQVRLRSDFFRLLQFGRAVRYC